MSTTTTSQGIPLIGPLLNKIIGTRNDRFVKKYTQRVEAIDALEPEMRRLTDTQLREKFTEFRRRVKEGESVDSLMIEAFAVGREAMDRSIGIKSILNPAHGFDPSRLPDSVRGMYDEAKAKAEATEAAPPTGEFRGCSEDVPGWRQVEMPVELYEAVRELYPESRPPFRSRPFNVQLIGAMVLFQGKIAEMKTGEGKTIVAPLASYLGAIAGMKVHVVTVNDYLVQRDRDWTFPFFHALGLTVGAIHPQHMQPEQVKREMYHCDVVYGTTSEFGFDYLRDNMKRSVDQQVQRDRHFAIVDEVDSVLIDEARTPLIISGAAHDDQPRYDLADRLARHLVDQHRPWQQADDALEAAKRRIKGLEGDIRNTRDKDRVPAMKGEIETIKGSLASLEADRANHRQYYEVEMDKRQCHLTHEGIAEAQKAAGVGSFYVGENMDVPHLLENALRARVVYERDRDYIVMDVPDRMTGRTEASVVIVDTNTGRPMIGRQWSDGLHQAVESKEGVPIKQETQTVATITIQNLFKMYKRLAGMTGTADTEAQEFHDIYSLDVVSIPTNVPVERRDFDDLIFLLERDKWDTIVEEIRRFHDVGRPILVGTTSVEKSETLSRLLAKASGIQHSVLNAKQHEKEAHVIEDAGQTGAVMIATNMAGRGTDIKLGKFTREQLVEHWLRRGLASRGLTTESTEQELRENVYRKVAPRELDIQKREAETMGFEELELALLRKWANDHTWAAPKKIEQMNAEQLREELDGTGRSLLHRLRWFESIEDMGGLHVIGTERHESRRIDNQLRGRSGRQGDNGSSRFFVSFEDDLMKLFAGETTMRILSRFGMKEGDAMEHPMLSKSVERAQRKVEERNFQIRKNLLEMDEVMEHQRQAFYGLRQRVLEGRDVKDLLFDFVRRSVSDAAHRYLDRDYAAECAAEYARQQLEASIVPERLRGLDAEDMIDRIRRDAKDDARQAISITMGEYLPDASSEIEVDFDAPGLAGWAKNHYGVELDVEELRQHAMERRRSIEDALAEAAAVRIDAADLSGVEKFLEKNYGARQLSDWCDRKFSIEMPSDRIADTFEEREEAGVVELILEQATQKYKDREINYPVEFQMDMARAVMQRSPEEALTGLTMWANRRYQMGWTPEHVASTPPNKIREELIEASKRWVESEQTEKILDEAASVEDDDAKLAKFFEEKTGAGVPERILSLRDEDRSQAVQSRIESFYRAELLYFERTLLLEVLDTSWKDHLYTMDQLRDSIGFRGFAQQDYRIEFKREGSTQFGEMMDTVRDRITDYLFKVRLSPNVQGQQQQQAPRQAPAMAMAPVGAGMISGPGLDAPSPRSPAAPPPPPPAATPRPPVAPQPAPTPEGDSPADIEARAGSREGEARKSTRHPGIGGKKRRKR